MHLPPLASQLVPLLNTPIWPLKISIRTTRTINAMTAMTIVFNGRPWAFLRILEFLGVGSI